MVNNVQIYGGFPTGGSTFLAHDWNANPTILNGDLGTIDYTEDNAYHVVVSTGNVGNARLDGLHLVDGNANSSGSFSSNSMSVDRLVGGGMYNEDSSPTINNSIVFWKQCYKWKHNIFRCKYS